MPQRERERERERERTRIIKYTQMRRLHLVFLSPRIHPSDSVACTAEFSDIMQYCSRVAPRWQIDAPVRLCLFHASIRHTWTLTVNRAILIVTRIKSILLLRLCGPWQRERERERERESILYNFGKNVVKKGERRISIATNGGKKGEKGSWMSFAEGCPSPSSTLGTA